MSENAHVTEPNPLDSSALTFACPICPERPVLLVKETALACEICGASFPLARGVPILINDRNSVFSIADYAVGQSYAGDAYGKASDGVRGWRRAYHRFASRLSGHAVARQYLGSKQAVAIIQSRIERARILVIGAGDTVYEGKAKIVYTDVAFSPNVACICDAHDLPFPNGYFDAVIAVAVMEHVAEPVRCAVEIWRVLRPQGFVYSTTPFLQPVHMGAYDFTRFTYLGHRRLFRYFDDVESGIALGPGATIAWSVQYLLLSFSDRRWYRRISRLLGLIMTFPLKYLDYLASDTRSAYDAAGGFYFLGQRRDAPISDRDLIKLYRGGIAS